MNEISIYEGSIHNPDIEIHDTCKVFQEIIKPENNITLEKVENNIDFASSNKEALFNNYTFDTSQVKPKN